MVQIVHQISGMQISYLESSLSGTSNVNSSTWTVNTNIYIERSSLNITILKYWERWFVYVKYVSNHMETHNTWLSIRIV